MGIKLIGWAVLLIAIFLAGLVFSPLCDDFNRYKSRSDAQRVRVLKYWDWYQRLMMLDIALAVIFAATGLWFL